MHEKTVKTGPKRNKTEQTGTSRNISDGPKNAQRKEVSGKRARVGKKNLRLTIACVLHNLSRDCAHNARVVLSLRLGCLQFNHIKCFCALLALMYHTNKMERHRRREDAKVRWRAHEAVHSLLAPEPRGVSADAQKITARRHCLASSKRVAQEKSLASDTPVEGHALRFCFFFPEQPSCACRQTPKRESTHSLGPCAHE